MRAIRILRERAGLRAAAAASTAALVLAAAGPAHAAGAPATAFNGSGVITTPGVQLLGVAAQSNGDVVAAGQSGGHVLVERFTPAGAPAGSYTGPAGVARAVAVEPGGQIVLAGSTGGAMLVERLTSSLSPDPSFGSGGIATVFGGSSGVANAVALGPGGTIIAAGDVGSGGYTEMAVAELTSAGSLDTGFGGSGTVLLDFGGTASNHGDAVAMGAAVQPDGKVLLAGHYGAGNVVNAILARLDQNGAVDGTFAGGSGADLYWNSTGAFTSFNAVTIQNDGKIVVAGFDPGPDALIARYNADGSFDTSFGSGGVASLPSGVDITASPGPAGAYGVAVAGGGHLVAGGSFLMGGAQIDAAVYAVTPSGTSPGDFGSFGGDTEISPTTTGSSQYEACATAVTPDGTIVTAGDTPTTDQNPCGTGAAANGFVAEYTGYGPPPPPPSGPAGSAPQVSTGGAGAVTTTSATVSGSVDPEGLATTYYFQYGTSTMYGSSTPTHSAGAGTTAVAEATQLVGLAPGTTYHYRIVASNADGTTYGGDQQFTTAAPQGPPPSVQTGGASAVHETSARISATVNPQGSATTYYFEYGPGAALSSRTADATLTAGPASQVTALLRGLRPGTTYEYRIVASNSGGTSLGQVRRLRTVGRLKVALGRLPERWSTATVLKSGLKVGVKVDQPARTEGALLIDGRTAASLGLGHKPLAIGQGVVTIRRTGRMWTLSVHILSQYTRALSRQKHIAVLLRTVSQPLAGGPAVTIRRTLTLNS